MNAFLMLEASDVTVPSAGASLAVLESS